MIRIAFSTLRFRKASFLASFVAMFVGATIVMACGGLMETGLRTNVTTTRLAAAPIVVTANQSASAENEWSRVDSRLVEMLQSVPGVAKAIGDVSFPAAVLKQGQPVLAGSQGHGWASAELAPYTLSSGVPPAAPGEVVLHARHGVKVGDPVEVAVAGRTESFRVSGIAQGPKPALFFSPNDTVRLSPRPGVVDSIGVLTVSGVDDLTQRITSVLDDRPLVVLTGDARGAAEFPEAVSGADRLRILASVFGSWTALVMIFGVASMIALTVQQRRRELALLKAIGTTPRQVRRMIVVETMTVSLIATALAYLPSRYLGELLFDQLTTHHVASPMLRFSQGWLPGLIGAVAALAAAFGAALVASKRAARTSPVLALTESASDSRPIGRVRLVFALVFALLLIAGGLSLSAVTVAVMSGPLTAATAGWASILVVMGLALLAPGIARGVAVVLRRPASAGVAGALTVQNARTQFRRLASVIAPVIMVTGFGVATLYMQATDDDANQQVFLDNLRADLVVSSTVGGLRPDVVDQVRAVPGVLGASEFVTGTATFLDPLDTSQLEGWTTHGLTGSDAAATTAVQASEGTLADLTGRTAALPTSAAQKHGLHLGDSITVQFGDGGRETLRLVAFFPARKGNERLVVPASMLATHTTVGLPTQILLRAQPGVDLSHLTVPGLRVDDRSVLVAAQSTMHRTLAAANYTIVAMIMGFTALTVVNTLVAATSRRRQEFGLMRLAGSTRGQVLRTLGMEGLLVTVIGVVLGSIASLATLLPFSLVKKDTLLPSGTPLIYIAVVGSVAAITLTATLWPTWRALRTSPISSLDR